MKYFWKDASGVNADIERHQQKEKELREKIAVLEEQGDEISIRALDSYRYFLNQLLESKAQVTSQIGKK